MGFKKVESSFAKPWAPKVGEFIVGVYKGKENVPSPPQRAKKPGETFISYRIGDLEQETLDEEGNKVRTIGVSGAMLGSKFNQIPKGARIKLTYAGTQKTGKGDAKMFDVEVDDNVTLLDPDSRPASEEAADDEHIPF